MIDVIDEVLSDKPTFIIKNSAGEILHDNVQIELKTPVIQEGTPINRALFQSIIKDIGEKADIKVYALSDCYIDADNIETEESIVILGYAKLDETAIIKGLGILKKQWGME